VLPLGRWERPVPSRTRGEAANAFERAARGAPRSGLYLAQLELARTAAAADALTRLSRRSATRAETLAERRAGKANGEFVRGNIAALSGRDEEANRALESFVAATTLGRVALAIALAAETAAPGPLGRLGDARATARTLQ
jgi:hypothetical protein